MIPGRTIRLRAVEREDLPRFVEWLNDPLVRRGLSQIFPLSRAQEERWFEAELEKEPHERSLAIEAKRGKSWALIGGCGLFHFDRYSRSAELGIFIGDRRYWDRGFGTEAMRTLMGFAFEALNLHRLFLRVFASNARALKVYARVGFREEGRLREDHFAEGTYEDTVVMGILEAEWRAASGGKG